MSWDEIKKAVNSDIAVPLDKKIGYTFGLVERGVYILKNVSMSISTNFDTDLIMINGRGMITNMDISLLAQVNPITMTIDIDSGSKTITMLRSSEGKTSIAFDANMIGSTGDVTEKVISVHNKQISIDLPLLFNKALSVHITHNGMSSYPAQAHVSYVLTN